MKIISVSLALATTAVSADQAHKLSPRHRTRRMQNGGSHHGQNGGHKGPRAQHPRHTHPLKDHPNRGHHHKQAEEDDGTLSDEDLAALLEDKDDADGPQACPFCPNGLTMESDYVLPTNSRQDDPITCGQVQDFASTLVILPEPADSTFEKEECAKVQLAEIFCCPSDEELDIINEPGPEIPIEDGDEEGRLPETQEPSQEGTEFPTEPMDTETEPTALPDDVSPEATTTTTAEEMVDATTTLPENIDIDGGEGELGPVIPVDDEEEETEPTVTPGDDVHDGSDSPPIAGAKSSKANTSAAEQPSSSKSNKTMDAKAGKDDPEQHPTKKSSSSTTTSKTGKEASEKSASAKGDTEAKSGKESSTTGSKAEKKNGLSMPHKEKSSGGLSMPAKMSSAKNSSKTKTSKEASTSSAPKLGTKAASMPPIHSSMPLTAVAKSSKQTKPNDDAAPHESSSTAKSSKKKEQGDHVPLSDKSKSSKSEELHKVDIVDAKAQKTDTKAQKTDSAKAQKEQNKSDAINNKSGKTSKTVVVHAVEDKEEEESS